MDPSSRLPTLANPFGYKLPKMGLDENFDWTPQLREFGEGYRNRMNEIVKRFIQKIKESRGYDVDCIPPWWFGSPFYPQDYLLPDDLCKTTPFYANKVVKAAEFAIGVLKAKYPDNTYELVDIQKVVTDPPHLRILLTFTVKVANGAIITYQAAVRTLHDGSKGFELIELNMKTDSGTIAVSDATPA